MNNKVQKHEVDLKKRYTERWQEFIFLISTFTGPLSGEPQTQCRDTWPLSDTYRVKGENCTSMNSRENIT